MSIYPRRCGLTDQARTGDQIQFNRVENNAIAIAALTFSIFSNGFGRLSGARKQSGTDCRRAPGQSAPYARASNAALGLLRFGGFGTETVDITCRCATRSCWLSYIACCCARRWRAVLQTNCSCRCTRTCFVFDMNNFIDDRIEEVAVVRDQIRVP